MSLPSIVDIEANTDQKATRVNFSQHKQGCWGRVWTWIRKPANICILLVAFSAIAFPYVGTNEGHVKIYGDGFATNGRILSKVITPHYSSFYFEPTKSFLDSAQFTGSTYKVMCDSDRCILRDDGFTQQSLRYEDLDCLVYGSQPIGSCTWTQLAVAKVSAWWLSW